MDTLNRLAPRSIDSRYTGSRAALWLLGLVLLVRSAQSISVLAAGPSVVQGADGIPLDTFAPDAAGTIVAVVGLAALARLVICLSGFLVLARYRAAVGLVFLVLVVEHVGRMMVLLRYPIVRVGAPVGPIVNHGLFACMLLGLVLSLWPESRLGAGDSR